MPDRRTTLTAALAIIAVALLSLLFISSYAGALHDPKPHNVPVAVAARVPAPLRERLAASPAVAVREVAGAAAARRAIDRREAYGALLAGRAGLTVVVAPAASPAIAEFLSSQLARQLRAGGEPVTVRTVHPLPGTDTRGLVAFYTVIGWAIAGYDRGFATIAAFGLLTVLATGAATVALQSLFGILGTGIASGGSAAT